MQADLDFNPACALIQLCDRGELLSLSELRCPSLGDGTALPGLVHGRSPALCPGCSSAFSVFAPCCLCLPPAPPPCIWSSEFFSDNAFPCPCQSWPSPLCPPPTPPCARPPLPSPWHTPACPWTQRFLPWLHSECPKAAGTPSFTEEWTAGPLSRVLTSGPGEPRRACSLPPLSLHPGRVERE